ncbi:hypothetical protein FK535_09190 [Mycolicibacterium sp. 018/SC-01/001]|uniref:hypothetical protein n=1 Tax=Mycolicibacterium sp. 018/SC-01/001 TaxID=2592069 RepID=UPI00117F6FD6|nr:hypothetical protein [Mycolicibacterium sp. 018/SC-01/001]TRW85560.1 hypothetical protein FK535_09190 [Mycolicibacterium sp. 018/SC-01/001]
MAYRLHRLNQLRRVIGSRLFAVLDSEGVVFFQSLVYLHLAVAGAYGLTVAGGTPESLTEALGPHIDTVWLCLCMGGTICLLGKIFSSKPDRRRYWVHTTGLLLQFAGDLLALGAFLGYVLATVQDSSWGKALVAVWVFASLAECAFFLCWRDLRRFIQAERRVRR